MNDKKNEEKKGKENISPEVTRFASKHISPGPKSGNTKTVVLPPKPESMPETLTPEAEEPLKTASATTGGKFKTTTILPRFEQGNEGLKAISDANNRFEPQKIIGEGGAGEVELVMDRDISRLVAVKRMKGNLQQSKMLMRFVDEIRTVGQLEHPNIVPIHDVGQDGEGRYYFVMKYVEGETLHQIIEKLQQGDPVYHKKYSFQYRVGIFTEILKAVEFAHHNGIIHRDIKPMNVMVGPHGEVTLMDWGIAKIIRGGSAGRDHDEAFDRLKKAIMEMKDEKPQPERLSQTQDNTTLGTPAYMAPEQVEGKSDKHDERTDIYSLSALFYEFLTLQSYLRPKKTWEEVMRGIMFEKPKMAMLVSNKFQSSVPAALTHFLARGLEKDPDKRFQSVKEMQKLLQKIIEGYAPVQCPFTLTQRVLNSLVHLVNNMPMIGLMLFMLLIFFVMGGMYLLFYEILPHL